MTIINTSSTAYLLVIGVHNTPVQLPALSLTDDLGFSEACMHSLHSQTLEKRTQGLWIPPGESYAITVQLRCVPQNQGILQQWLLVVLCSYEIRNGRWFLSDPWCERLGPT